MAYEEINERAFGWDDEIEERRPRCCAARPRETTCSL